QSLADEFGDAAKLDAAIEKCSNRRLIGSIEDGAGVSTGVNHAIRQCHRAKTLGIHRLEIHLAQRAPIQWLGASSRARWPSERILNRRLHIGRAELGNNRMIDKLHEAVNQRLRM